MPAYVIDPGCAVDFAGSTAIIDSPRGPLRVTDLAPGQSAVLARLTGTPVTREALVGIAAEDPSTSAAWVHMILDRLVGLGFVARVVGSPAIARSTVTAPGHEHAEPEVADGCRVVLDRLAYLRADAGAMVLESPRAFTRITLLEPSVAGFVASLATPATMEELRKASPLGDESTRDLIDLLVGDGFVIELPPDADDLGNAWTEWSFHDALFHSRSRSGRHGYPYGATYSREGHREPLPAVRERPPGRIVELATAETDPAAGPRFGSVLEARQSWRNPGPEPLHCDDLGEFLWRSARVRGRRGTEHEEVSNRPYPGGGADYELEIYVLAHRVTGLERGLYAYDPLEHVLVQVCDWTPQAEQLARDVCEKTADKHVPDVALLVTARMHRLTYKYESIPYAVALKDVGALYGTWYLTATAMGLAPCAIGGGDSEVLAQATGIPSWIEPRIGEFILNTQDPAEVRGSLPPARVSRPRAGAREQHG